MGQDGHCQQFHTTPTLISVPQWPHRPCNAPMRPYTVGEKPSMKADLAIYSQTVDVGGQCMSESIKLGHNLDFSSCDIMVGFHKSSHILTLCKPLFIVNVRVKGLLKLYWSAKRSTSAQKVGVAHA